jgi:hypothetical protein
MLKFHVNEPEDEDGFVWVKKGDEQRFKVARNGDNLTTLFQCDLCVFRHVIKREPSESYPDRLALCAYRLVNLAALWSRERSMVTNNKRWVQKGARLNQVLGQIRTYPTLGPMPLEDVTGHGVAAQMLMASCDPDKYHTEYSQYDTIPKLRSAYSSL